MTISLLHVSRWLMLAILPFWAAPLAWAQSPTLLSLTRTSPAAVVVGDTITFQLGYTVGASGLTSAKIYLTDASGQSRTTTVSLPQTGAMLTLQAQADWLSGSYALTQLVLVDASGNIYSYERNGSASITAPSQGGVTLSTHAMNFAAQDISLTGGLAAVIPPTLSAVTPVSSSTVRQGETAKYSAVMTQGAGSVELVGLTFTGPNGHQIYLDDNFPDGNSLSQAVITANDPPGVYTLTEVNAYQVQGRYYTFQAGGSVRVIPAILDVTVTHNFDFSAVTLTVQAPLPDKLVITRQPQSPLPTLVGAPATFSVIAVGPGVLTYRWIKYPNALSTAGTPVPGATTETLAFPQAQTSDIGTYAVEVSNGSQTVLSQRVDLSVVAPLVLLAQTPRAVSLNGQSVTLSVTPNGRAAFQWYVGESGDTRHPISGAVNAQYTTPTLTESTSYWVRVMSPFGSLDSRTIPVELGSFQGIRLTNISTRAYVGSGADVLIAGFIISGDAPKTVLIRASGPGLQQFGVSGALADPELELHKNGVDGVLAHNDNWGDVLAEKAQLQEIFTVLHTFEWADGSKDAALLATLTPGAYTAVVLGRNNSAGVAIVEVNEVDLGNNASRLINISSRALVKTGDNVQIAGFIITGQGTKKVVIRASGPALVKYQVPGVLADPTVEIHQNGKSEVIASNDDWDILIRPDFVATGSDNWAINSKDAAVVLTLPAGGYTAIVRGKNDGTGVALIEVNEEN